MNRIILLLVAAAAFPAFAQAQLAINPQIGLNMTNLTEEPEGSEFKASAGFMIGADLRIGDRFYFQPGAFYVATSTAVTVGDSLKVDDNLTTSNLKLKGLVGYNLIDGDAFRLRLNAGPTYNILMSVGSADDKIKFDKDDFNSGSFNLDAGLGADISIITVETGISYGLSKAFKEQDGFENDSKYFTFYFTAGLVFGGANQ